MGSEGGHLQASVSGFLSDPQLYTTMICLWNGGYCLINLRAFTPGPAQIMMIVTYPFSNKTCFFRLPNPYSWPLGFGLPLSMEGVWMALGQFRTIGSHLSPSSLPATRSDTPETCLQPPISCSEHFINPAPSHHLPVHSFSLSSIFQLLDISFPASSLRSL